MRRACAALALVATLALTGCVYLGEPVPHPGINTPFDGLSDKRKAELLDETIAHVDKIAQLVGGEFLDSGIPPTVFDPVTAQQEPWDWSSCDNEATTGQYVVAVWQDAVSTNEFDPESLTKKVRAYWEGLGYKIRQIGPTPQDETLHRSINVDLPHSAGLHFSASTRILGVSAHSACTRWEK